MRAAVTMQNQDTQVDPIFVTPKTALSVSFRGPSGRYYEAKKGEAPVKITSLLDQNAARQRTDLSIQDGQGRPTQSTQHRFAQALSYSDVPPAPLKPPGDPATQLIRERISGPDDAEDYAQSAAKAVNSGRLKVDRSAMQEALQEVDDDEKEDEDEDEDQETDKEAPGDSGDAEKDEEEEEEEPQDRPAPRARRKPVPKKRR